MSAYIVVEGTLRDKEALSRAFRARKAAVFLRNNGISGKMSTIGMAAVSLDYDDRQESRDAALSICRDGAIRRPRQAGASRSLGSS